jgi:DNA-binding MarR family transcriptional regulator
MENIGQLLIALHKAHRTSIAHKLKILNLYPGQDGLLYHLSQNDGLTMSELVEKLQIRHPTLFIMVNRMEKSGIIQKDKDTTDKRTSRVFLTAKGQEQVSQLSRIWSGIENQLLKDFSQTETTQVKSILNKLINNLTSE